MNDLQGKNAILTGGSRGIGTYIARALACEGVNLALAARSVEQLKLAAGEVAKLGLRAIAIPADVTREADRTALVERAQEELGQIDILVNNAGIGQYTRFSRQKPEDMIRIVETNLMAPLFLTRKLLPGMLERGCGHIVNIASMAGKKGIPYEATYTASKAGLIEFSNALRTELEDTGVDVSVICPVYVSKVGMFAVYEVPAPRLAGSVSPQQVSKAVIRVIRQNIGELILRSSPTRPLLALNALSPRLGDLIIKSMGVVKFQRRMADDLESKDINSANKSNGFSI